MAREVLCGPLTGEPPELELAFAHALVRRASRGELDEVVRVYRPLAPMVVLGRRDMKRPGFGRAVQACAASGFTVSVRATGGRAVAYTPQSIVIDHVRREPDAASEHEHRFRAIGAIFVELLKGYGVDARLGPVPGEYCPGAHSVNARGVVKLIGTAQRVVKDAWLFSSLVLLDGSDEVRPLLSQVYDALELPFDESSVGSVLNESRQTDLLELEQAITDSLAPQAVSRPTAEDAATLSLARELLPQHRVT